MKHTLVSCCQTQKNVGLGIQKKFPEYEKSSSDMPTFVSIQALNDCTQTYNKRYSILQQEPFMLKLSQLKSVNKEMLNYSCLQTKIYNAP